MTTPPSSPTHNGPSTSTIHSTVAVPEPSAGNSVIVGVRPEERLLTVGAARARVDGPPGPPENHTPPGPATMRGSVPPTSGTPWTVVTTAPVAGAIFTTSAPCAVGPYSHSHPSAKASWVWAMALPNTVMATGVSTFERWSDSENVSIRIGLLSSGWVTSVSRYSCPSPATTLFPQAASA